MDACNQHRNMLWGETLIDVGNGPDADASTLDTGEHVQISQGKDSSLAHKLQQVIEFEHSKLKKLTRVRDVKLKRLQELGSLDTAEEAEHDMQLLMSEINDLNRQTRALDFSEDELMQRLGDNLETVYHKRQDLTT